MSDEDLRRLYQRALRAPAAGKDNDVTPEELLALVERRGDESARLEILDRVMASEGTRREFELLRATARSGRALASPASARRWTVPAAAAAALVLVSLAAIMLFSRGDESPVMRGGLETVELLKPADGATVSGEEARQFAWKPVPGAVRYTLELLDSNRTAISTTGTADTAALTDALLPPGSYYWLVEVLREDGSRRRSGVREFQVIANASTTSNQQRE